jgi:hypothetical protein
MDEDGNNLIITSEEVRSYLQKPELHQKIQYLNQKQTENDIPDPGNLNSEESPTFQYKRSYRAVLYQSSRHEESVPSKTGQGTSDEESRNYSPSGK